MPSVTSSRRNPLRVKLRRTPVCAVGVARNGTPILLRGYRMREVPENRPLRAELERKELDELASILRELRPDQHNTSDLLERGRTVRAIEIARFERDQPASDDGWPDLLVANDFGVSELYMNEQGARFREVGRGSNIGRSPKSGMNATAADVLDRGEWDLFVSNIAEPGVLLHGNDLWVPSERSGATPRFTDLAGAMGVEVAGWSYGAQFGDLDNDGWLDLYVANGHVSGRSRESYWYDYSKVAGGNESIIGNTRNWPALAGRSLSGYQQDRVWKNDGAGRFEDVGQTVGVTDRADGRAVALADLWNRGVLDVVVASQRGPLRVYRNTATATNNWLELELRGSRSNRSAVGAEVRLYWQGREQLQQVDGGSGFAAQNDRRLHFGLGRAAAVDSVVIRWPSGRVQTLGAPAINRLHVVTEAQ